MRGTSRAATAIQCALASIMLAPLLAALWGGAGFSDAFAVNENAESAAARRAMLLRAWEQSLSVGLLSAAVAALIGIPAAWALASRRASAVRTALTVLPLALPAPVAVSGWVRLIAPNATSSFALQLPNAPAGWVSSAHALLFSSLGAGLVLGFSLWPIVALNAWPGFARARDSSYDAARLYGSPMRAFFQTVVPRCRGVLGAGIALVFLIACNDFAVPSLLLVKTLTVEVHDQAALGKNAAAAWAALPLVLTAAILCVALMRRPDALRGNAGAEPRGGERSGRAASGALFAGVAFGFAIPMAACLFGVISSGKALSVSFDAGAGSMGLSARLAAAAVLISVGLATLRVVCWPEARATALGAAGVFLLAIPGSFLGVSILELQVRATDAAPVLQLPLGWMALGLALRFSYVALRLADEALGAIDPGILESAALLGHSRASRAFAVALPLSSGFLAAAGALIFALALGEVPIASILAPPGAVPATIWLFGQQHMGYDESVFALSLLLGATAAVAVALGAWGARAWAAR